MRRYIGMLLFAMGLTVSVANFDYSSFCDVDLIQSNAYGIFLIFFWAYMLVATYKSTSAEDYEY